MESTTKKLIANAIGSTSVFNRLQIFFVPVFLYCNSLPSDYENRSFMISIFWHFRLRQSGKPILLDLPHNYFQKIKHETTTTTKFLS